MKNLLLIVNYNQENEIAAFLTILKNFYSLTDTIVVDDGSTDKSPEIAKSLGYNVISHKQNSGVGATLRTGFNFGLENKYDSVLIMSSNGKLKPEEITTVMDPVINGDADYVTGSRFLIKGSSIDLGWFRHLGIKIFSLLAYPILGRLFSDVTCGFRCYKLDFISSLNINQKWLDKYEMEYYIHYFACKKKLKIQEVPVTVKYNHLDYTRRTHIKPFIGWWSMARPLVFLGLGIKK